MKRKREEEEEEVDREMRRIGDVRFNTDDEDQYPVSPQTIDDIFLKIKLNRCPLQPRR